MAKLLCLLLFIVISGILSPSGYVMGLPTPDEERYLDKEYNRDLMSYLNSIPYPVLNYNPCSKSYATNDYYAPYPKRNSELINSLLSLPKNMNDAGKK